MDGVLTEYYQAVATYATSVGLLESGGDWYDMSPSIELAAITVSYTHLTLPTILLV